MAGSPFSLAVDSFAEVAYVLCLRIVAGTLIVSASKLDCFVLNSVPVEAIALVIKIPLMRHVARVRVCSHEYSASDDDICQLFYLVTTSMSAEGRLLDRGGYNRPVPWRGSTVSCLQPMDMMAVYQEGVSESSMFSHFPQRPVGVNRSSHVGSSNRQPSLGDKGHYSEPHGRSMSPDYRFESDVFKQYSNLCVQNTMSRSRETSEGCAKPSVNSPPDVLQATTHAATSGSNQRKRTRANTQAELAVAEGSSLNTRVIDENDERLKGLKENYREDVHRVVAVPVEHTSPQSYGTSQRAEKLLYKDLLAF
ncbi:hypothetical protein Tco_0045651 [Tanacetum coccineum]